MAQWRDLQRLDSALQSRVSQLYEGRLPREIRHCLSAWIESQDWDLAAEDENKASACFHDLLEYLEGQRSRSVQENNILQGPDYSWMEDYFVKHFHDNTLNLAILLSECLKEEKKILDLASETQGCSSPGMEPNWRELDNRVNELKQQTWDIKKEMKTLEGLNEKLDFIQKKWQSKVEQHVGLAQSQDVMEEECRKRAVFISQTKQIVIQQLVNILNQAGQIVVTLTDVELPKWKCRQQMACIGSPADTCLDHLQKWFTTVADVLLRIHEQLHKLQEQSNKYNNADTSSLAASVAEIEKFALALFRKLITNALVVEKQPVIDSLPQRPLVIKTKVLFKVTVRFLANLPEFKYKLSVQPVFDKDVAEATTVSGFRHFDMSGATQVLDVNTPGGGLMAEFGSMSLEENKAKTKGSSEPPKKRKARNEGSSETRLVTEELHVISFVTEFQHARQTYNIEARSLPVVVISSTSQVSDAWASILWWNMLSTSEPWDLSLFVKNPPLTWQQLSQVLSWQFLSVGQRALDENQLSMLRDKVVDNPDGLVHWSKFTNKDDGAWIWIDGILDLIKKHLVDTWRDGSIMGFVSRERTRSLLENKPTGTFLLRFSESNKDGAITFSWVDHSSGETHVHAVQPYTKSELASMSLADTIYHYTLTAPRGSRNPLLYLYPDTHKDAAFRRYKSTERSAPIDILGYVNRRPASVSVNPTPPPSPPTEMNMMEVDNDADTSSDVHQLQEEFFNDLLGLPEPDILWSSYPETHHLCPLSPQADLADDLIYSLETKLGH